MDPVKIVAERLKLTQEEAAKLRSTADLAGATTEETVTAVLAGLRRGQENTAFALEAIKTVADFPKRVDECPVCYANMAPITLASNREAFFCPIHNVVMPFIE